MRWLPSSAICAPWLVRSRPVCPPCARCPRRPPVPSHPTPRSFSRIGLHETIRLPTAVNRSASVLALPAPSAPVGGVFVECNGMQFGMHLDTTLRDTTRHETRMKSGFATARDTTRHYCHGFVNRRLGVRVPPSAPDFKRVCSFHAALFLTLGMQFGMQLTHIKRPAGLVGYHLLSFVINTGR